MRRLLASLIIAMGTATVLIAFAFLMPVRHAAVGWRFVMRLASLPDDDVGRVMSIWAEERDGWCRGSEQPIHRVILLRDSDTGEVRAFATQHLTDSFPSPVDYDGQRGIFVSRCWPATFDRTGRLRGDADRLGSDDMIRLTTKIDACGLWVEDPSHIEFHWHRYKRPVPVD